MAFPLIWSSASVAWFRKPSALFIFSICACLLITLICLLYVGLPESRAGLAYNLFYGIAGITMPLGIIILWGGMSRAQQLIEPDIHSRKWKLTITVLLFIGAFLYFILRYIPWWLRQYRKTSHMNGK